MSVLVVDAAAEPSPPGPSDAAATQYQSLYRRYRPQRFSEVRGQDPVVSTLRNAVRDGRTVHAYLFSGPRGTGKTSTARILAKALNCTSPSEGEPCGNCESCLDIARGGSLDVHELDAASNNGVDAMRDLVARSALATPGKRKVYIIDEVHMLSTAASNALLKTLEEPPPHVVFVLATTDPQKVLPTIRSRTQHFEFHLLEQPVLEGLLTDIALDARLELPEDGVGAAVRRGHGSARDALSMLDQVAVSGVVAGGEQYVHTLVVAIAEQDVAHGLNAIGEGIVAGFDAQRLTVELVEALREQFLMSVAAGVARPEPESRAADGRALVPPARCVRSLELLGAALVDMREAIDPRTTLEVALVRLTNPDVDDSTSALLDRIERLERRVSELSSVSPGSPPAGPGPPPPGAGQPVGTSAPTSSGARPALGAFRSRPGEQPPPQAPEPPGPESAQARERGARGPAGSQAEQSSEGAVPSRDDLVTAWADSILPRLRPRVKMIYAVGRFLSVDGRAAVLALPNVAHVTHAEPLRSEVEAVLEEHFATRLELRLVVDNEGAPEVADDAGSRQPPVPERTPPLRTKSGPISERPAGTEKNVSDTSEAGVSPATPSPSEGGASRSPTPDEGDFDEIRGGDHAAGPHDSASWAEHRVREAFPGVEEVS